MTWFFAKNLFVHRKMDRDSLSDFFRPWLGARREAVCGTRQTFPSCTAHFLEAEVQNSLCLCSTFACNLETFPNIKTFLNMTFWLFSWLTIANWPCLVVEKKTFWYERFVFLRVCKGGTFVQCLSIDNFPWKYIFFVECMIFSKEFYVCFN